MQKKSVILFHITNERNPNGHIGVRRKEGAECVVVSCVVVLGSVLCGGVGFGSVSVVVLSSVLCGGVVVSLVLVVSVW